MCEYTASFDFTRAKTVFSGFLLLQETHLEKQGFGGIGGLGGLLALPATCVVPDEPNVLRLGMPAQSAWEFRSFLILHVICFLQISQSVKQH